MKEANFIVLIFEQRLNLGVFVNLFSRDKISEEWKTSIDEWTVISCDRFQKTALFNMLAEETWLFGSEVRSYTQSISYDDEIFLKNCAIWCRQSALLAV